MNRLTSVFTLTAVSLMFLSGSEAISVSRVPQDAKDAKPVLVDVLAAWSQDSIPVSGMNQAPGEGRHFIIVLGKPRGLKNSGAFHVAARDASGSVIGFRSFFNEGGILESTEAVLTDSAGGRYVPISGLSGSFAFFRDRSVLSRDIRIDIPAGLDATFALVYEVPRKDSGYRLSVAKAEPITIQVNKK